MTKMPKTEIQLGNYNKTILKLFLGYPIILRINSNLNL